MTQKTHVVIITDSLASISIVEGFKQGVGVKMYLQPEAKVGMELVAVHRIQPKITHETIQVTSNVDREDAPNERYWGFNDLVDKLATEAREKTIQEELIARPLYMLPHSKVVCTVDHRMTTNNRDKILREKLSKESLMNHLCIK